MTLAEGRNAVNKEELPLIWSVAPESMIQGLGDEEGTVLVSRAVEEAGCFDKRISEAPPDF